MPRNTALDTWMNDHGHEVPVGNGAIGRTLATRLSEDGVPFGTLSQAYHYFAQWRKRQSRRRSRSVSAPPHDALFESIRTAKAALMRAESQYEELRAVLKEILG